MRLRTKLQWSVTLVTASALLASFVPLYMLVATAETRDLDHSLFRHAYAAARRLPRLYPAGRPLDEGWVKVPESFEPTIRYLAVYDADGDLRAASASFRKQAPDLERLDVPRELDSEGIAIDLELDGHELRGVLVPIHDQGEILLYAASQRSVVDDEQYLYQILIVLFVLATLVTSLVARWVGERLAREVHSIAGVAREVAQGNFDARVGAGVRGSDETQALAADLDHMISQLSALVEAQRTFISHAAHELRSPLTTLRGELQLALRRPRDIEEYQRALHAMLADVETLMRLAEDLLSLARVQANPSPHQRPRCHLAAAIDDARRLARGRAEERQVTVELHGQDAAEDIEVWCARGELARLLRNLIDNAITHSPVGGTVTVRVQPGNPVLIAVTDHGPGVTSEDQPHIFAPFYRGLHGGIERSVGAGLGLSIARAIASSCDGEVYLDPHHTDGARFVVTLPCITPDDNPHAHTPPRFA